MNGVVRQTARLYPWEVEPSEELVDALNFIDSPYSAESVIKAGYVVGTMLFFVVLIGLATVVRTTLLVTVPLAAFVGLAAVDAVHRAPRIRAAFRRSRALGDGPNLIGRAVLRMQIQPALENAVLFAAETGHGPLAENLQAHIDRTKGTPDAGLLSFAEEWADEFPAIRRAAHLLATAQDAPEAERVRTLDRALAAVLNGTREQMARFTSSISGPTTALYAFGVMVPLALVALVPAATIAGYPVSIWFFVITYNIVLPVVLVAASIWLLLRRPVAFPPPQITREHPDIPEQRWPGFMLGILGGVVAYLTTSVFGPDSLALTAGFGFGLGVALMAVYHPILQVRNYVRNVEDHLVDALYIIGRQVAEGEAVETAVRLAGDRVPAETGEVFQQAAGLQDRLHMGVEEAFLGEYGALSDVPSPRARSMASLLAIASEEGKPSGRALVSMADHLEELQEVEHETQREIRQVTGTLDNTAAFFGPIVAGSTVGMAGLIVEQGADAADVATLPVDQLGIVVGLFIITLCFVLTPLSIALRHGLDRAMLGYYIGRALVFALPLYVLTVAAIGLI